MSVKDILKSRLGTETGSLRKVPVIDQRVRVLKANVEGRENDKVRESTS